MVEFGVEVMNSIENSSSKSKGVGSKPSFVFLGDQWENESSFSRIQNLLTGMIEAVMWRRYKPVLSAIYIIPCALLIYLQTFSVVTK